VLQIFCYSGTQPDTAKKPMKIKTSHEDGVTRIRFTNLIDAIIKTNEIMDFQDFGYKAVDKNDL
jgi:hypothetical protein